MSDKHTGRSTLMSIQVSLLCFDLLGFKLPVVDIKRGFIFADVHVAIYNSPPSQNLRVQNILISELRLLVIPEPNPLKKLLDFSFVKDKIEECIWIDTCIYMVSFYFIKHEYFFRIWPTSQCSADGSLMNSKTIQTPTCIFLVTAEGAWTICRQGD